MIPVRLQLKNFMSYGEGVPPLDLSGMRLACLSGDNGNGKTALLDAMTWALFGATRASSSEDDVIRLGADDCAVLFDFLVEDVKYRIKRQRGRRGGSVWELQIWQEDGTLRSLSGANSRETKARIEQLLRMDYRTFLASGYLAQGRADEFTRASVGERKKVLADILDLSRYERLEEMAKERRKDAEDRELDAERTIRAIDAELEHEDRYHLDLETAQRRLDGIGAETAALQMDYERLLAQIGRMEEDERKATDMEERVREAKEEVERTNRGISDASHRIAAAEQMALKREIILGAHARADQLAAEIARLQPQYEESIALEREARTLDATIRDAREQLDRERYSLQRDVEMLEGEARDLVGVEAELNRIRQEIEAFGDVDARRQAAEALRKQAEDQVVALKGEHGAAKALLDAVSLRRQALCGSEASLCEYCGQPLPPAKRAVAIAEAEVECDRLAAELEQILARGRDAKRQVERHRKEVEGAQVDLTTIAKMDARRAQISQEQLRFAERTKTLPDLRRRVDRFTRQLAENDFAHAQQERRVQISARLEKLERVSQQLQSFRTEHAALKDAGRDLLLLQQAEQVLEKEPALVAEQHSLIAKRESQIEKAQRQIADIRARTAALGGLRLEMANAGAVVERSREMTREAERQIGQLTGKLERCAQLKQERVRWQDQRQSAAQDKDRYKELMAAFGKKGVQALIIENALPEIEEVANELLGRMTDGAMHLQLLTQREAKSKSVSGGAIETLDIVISDDLGTRPYEMYSGGEAFRINFALRVALSKLLARRAGARLQTLILDEGFGTQDPRGREAIVDALQTISEDFALILAITHIEEMKEAFPTRIEVVKGPNGSTFTIA